MSVTIGELAMNDVLSFSDGYRTKRSELGHPGYRILRVADVVDGLVTSNGNDYVSRDYEKQIGPKLSQPGDILLTTKGTVGRVAVMLDGPEPLVYSPQLCFFRVRDPERLSARWLSYWFKSDDFLRQASNRANNTDMAAYINLADIRSLRLPGLSIKRQRVIAEVLGALDDKIAANTHLASVADSLAAACVRRELDSGVAPLSSIAGITMGSSPPGSSFNDQGQGTVFYQGVRDFGVRFPTNRIWTNAPVRLAERGDTLVSVRAPVGRTNLAAERTCIGRGLAAIRSTKGNPMTLFHILRADASIWAPYEAEGTVFGSINRSQLAGLLVPVVRPTAAVGLERVMTAVEDRIEAALKESETLARKRDELLPLLMSGRIRVKDAEKVLEGVL